MNIFLIEFGTPLYSKAIELRDEVLRKPLNIYFEADQLAEEWNQFHLVALDENDEMKGVLVLKPLGKKRVKMRQVAVSPSAQRSGIGTKMVNASEKIAKEKGFGIMELSARDVSIPFYEKLKYNKVGEKFEEVSIPHFKMEKKLK
jgi:predicted GNAT family N-acyltransferase